MSDLEKLAKHEDERRKEEWREKQAHTPEPWAIRKECNGVECIGVIEGPLPDNCYQVAVASGSHHYATPNARRIVACVNACAGIKTEILEADEPRGIIVSPAEYHQFKMMQCDFEKLKAEICRQAERIAELEADGGHCHYAQPGRGDCEHTVGLPGKSIPGQHDGHDDTVDAYGKPNGWCWHCWLMHKKNEFASRAEKAEAEVERLTSVANAALSSAQYWKAEHFAGNDIISSQQSTTATLREALDIIRCYPAATEYIFNTAEQSLEATKQP